MNIKRYIMQNRVDVCLSSSSFCNFCDAVQCSVSVARSLIIYENQKQAIYTCSYYGLGVLGAIRFDIELNRFIPFQVLHITRVQQAISFPLEILGRNYSE